MIKYLTLVNTTLQIIFIKNTVLEKERQESKMKARDLTQSQSNFRSKVTIKSREVTTII